MELVTGWATVDDVETFVERLQAIGDEHGATVQALDARYVVDRGHLERAVELADRAIERGESIADDRAVEVLCYAAGTRQIREAMTIGVSAGDSPVVVLIDGGDEAAAAAAVRAMNDAVDVAADVAVGDFDAERVGQYYDIEDAELDATDAGIQALVRERVALLVVER